MEQPRIGDLPDAQTIWSRRWRLQNLYPIKTEDSRLVPLRFRPVQQQLFDKAEAQGFRGMRPFVLKNRKPGVTTFYELLYLDDSMFSRNRNTLIQAHRQDDLEKLFEIVRLGYEQCPEKIMLEDGSAWLKPKARTENKRELVFEGMHSKISVALSNIGGTNHNLHISEAASIEDTDERIRPTLETVPNREFGSNISVESTAKGVGGWFNETWEDIEAGESEFDGIFFAWFTSPKNRVETPHDFSPTAAEQELAAKVAERYGVLLDFAQLNWWRGKKQRLKHLMDQQHPSFPEDAFMTSDNQAFSAEAIARIVTRPPLRIWKKVSIWREPLPDRRYVLFADPAEGVQRDNSAICVIDAVTFEQVAEYASNTIPPTKFARTINRVGRYFNNALAAVERNNHGHTVLDRLVHELKYPNVFCMVKLDEKTQKKTKKLGWETNSVTRDAMLDDLDEALSDGAVAVRSAKLKGEIQTFITTETGRREAKAGKKDDRVITLAGAVKVARLPRPSFRITNLNK